MSLKSLTVTFISALVLINIATVLITYIVLSNKGVEIDVAGRNRMLSQRIVLFAGIYIQENNPKAKEICQQSLNLHDASILALKNGGEAPQMEGKYMQPALGERLDHLKRVERLWEDYLINTKIILKEPLYLGDELNPAILKSHNFLKQHATDMLKTNNALVKAYVNHNIAMELKVKTLLFMFVTISFVVFVFSILVFRSHLFRPIHEIVLKSKKVSLGEYNISFDHQAANELGTLKQALNHLFHKFREASTLVKEMGRGNFAYQIQISEKNAQNDTFIQALEDTQSKLSLAQQEDQIRNWMNEGTKKLGEIFRKYDLKLKEQSKLILAELIKYIQAEQGGIFLLTQDREEQYLSLISCYAYNRSKFLKKRIEIGEGIIGETFLEGKRRVMKNIPESYLEIKSGLGGTSPRYLMINPLKMNEEVLGIIEIASMEAFEPHQVEFIEQICGSIATTLSAKIKKEETIKLYHQAQQATEELKAAEEEMRQNMEELETTQEEMRRKESEYLRIIAELRANFKSNIPLSKEGIRELN